ncbi:hypothetical protein HanIR_Chr03g0123451 [Helianthus annuus]|nr:hypothetical protein HanIR_Chr03g0123451 [Helianthus annuus]
MATSVATVAPVSGFDDDDLFGSESIGTIVLVVVIKYFGVLIVLVEMVELDVLVVVVVEL